MEFDMVGIDASIANAFRRILIAEVGAFKIVHLQVVFFCLSESKILNIFFDNF